MQNTLNKIPLEEYMTPPHAPVQAASRNILSDENARLQGYSLVLDLIMIAYWTTIALPFSFYMSFLLDLGILVLLAAVAAFAQVYRYRYVSTPQQRQQTRLVVFGTVIAAGWNISARLLYYYVFIPHFQGSSLPGVLLIILISCSILVIPPSLGMAILRFHLWDIDMIINRTLVYSSLTFTLAVLYAGLIFTLQLFLRELTGQNDEVAIVISTLVIAALFHPLRQRIQLTIARRFYRSRYDAARTLETFGASLREQVDLERLEEDLVRTVEEIMQPSSISLWLRNHQSPQRRKTRILPELSDLILE